MVDDPGCELLVARPHLVDVRAADRLAVRPLELPGESGEELDGPGQGIDRPRIDEDEPARQIRIPRPEVDGDHPPRLCPTTTGCSIPTAAQNTATSSASSEIE